MLRLLPPTTAAADAARLLALTNRLIPLLLHFTPRYDGIMLPLPAIAIANASSITPT